MVDWKDRELFKIIEHEGQKKIVKCLREKFHCLVFDLDVMSALSFIHNEKDKIRFINEHKARGYTNGQPDIIAITPKGEVLFIEIKTKNGFQSDNQKKIEVWLLKHGQLYEVWKSVDDCLKNKKIIDI